jgi:hypothetical protein
MNYINWNEDRLITNRRRAKPAYGSGHFVIFRDLYELLTRGAPPDGRLGLQKIIAASGGPYWTFRR